MATTKRETRDTVQPIELLHDVKQRVVAQRDAKAIYADRLAPDFTPFEFIDTRETGLSRVLAWFLDPQSSHAQGDRFLKEFMRWLELDACWCEGASDARISTEVMTQFGDHFGYIDVLVVCGKRALAVENKPTAEDQEQQVARYLDDMKKRWPDGQCLLYLSGSGEGPSGKSIDQIEREREEVCGRLVTRGYSALIPWLSACRAVCRASSVHTMIDGLRAHVEKEFMGIANTKLAKELAERIVESRDTLEPALALFEARMPTYAALIKQLTDRVTEMSLIHGWSVTTADLSEARWGKLVIGFAEEAPVSFGIEFDRSAFRGLRYGMRSKDAHEIASELREAVEEVVGRAHLSPWWPVHRFVSPNDSFFPFSGDADSHFWLAVQSDDVAERIIEYVAKVERHLDEKGLLPMATAG